MKLRYGFGITILVMLFAVFTALAQTPTPPCAPCPDGAQCLLPECAEETAEPPIPDTPQIRLWNMSEYDLENIVVRFVNQREIYGTLESGQTSDYRPVEIAYRYAAIEAVINGRLLTLQPIDFVGETELEPGYYTYALDVDVQNRMITVELKQVVMTVEYRGGFCVDGACGSLVTLYDDGTYVIEYAAGEQIVSSIELGVAEELMLVVEETDFAAIRTQPFTGTCPLAYDGLELVYTFYTKQGVETIASCEFDIDMTLPVFRLVTVILENQQDAG